MSALPKARGLENVTALDSKICFIDGQEGILIYRGYNIHDLAPKATFEEVAYLLWNGVLPKQAELDALHAQLRAERAIPDTLINWLRDLPKEANPMAVMRTAVSALGAFDPEADDASPEANYRKALRLTAKMPTILATFARLRQGLEPLAPLTEGSTAYNFLYMLNGTPPQPAAERTFDICLILHAEHGLNASTFAGRVIGATLSDVYSAIAGAIGALKGPLHGGANIRVMQTLLEIDRMGQDPVAFVKDKLANKERIMGFGHRVYKTVDPRATNLRGMLKELSDEQGNSKWLDYGVAMMETMAQEKNLYPNVDFFSGALYYMLGIDIDLYTPIFAISRVTGWTAHLLEQWEDNRLIRPRAGYIGEKDLSFVPIAER